MLVGYSRTQICGYYCRLICTILDSFHYDVSLSTYTEAQVGQSITTDTAKKRQKAESQEEAVPQNERPEERPSNLPANAEPEAMNVDAVAEAANDDVDEGIDVRCTCILIFTW